VLVESEMVILEIVGKAVSVEVTVDSSMVVESMKLDDTAVSRNGTVIWREVEETVSVVGSESMMLEGKYELVSEEIVVTSAKTIDSDDRILKCDEAGFTVAMLSNSRVVKMAVIGDVLDATSMELHSRDIEVNWEDNTSLYVKVKLSLVVAESGVVGIDGVKVGDVKLEPDKDTASEETAIVVGSKIVGSVDDLVEVASPSVALAIDRSKSVESTSVASTVVGLRVVVEVMSTSAKVEVAGLMIVDSCSRVMELDRETDAVRKVVLSK
jgi:hypothetical protein